MPSSPPSQAKGVFGLFCLASYLLSVSYGSTFLLAMMLRAHGGNESDARHNHLGGHAQYLYGSDFPGT